MLADMGIGSENVVVVGCDYDDFKGFENVCVPVLKFTGSPQDNQLLNL